MPRARHRLSFCYAPGCKTGYSGVVHERKLSLFRAPTDDQLRLVWERNLRRLDKPLTADCAVCELHFEPHFIVRDYVHIINGAEVRIPRGNPRLAPGAVPTLLPNLTAYSSEPSGFRKKYARKILRPESPCGSDADRTEQSDLPDPSTKSPPAPRSRRKRRQMKIPCDTGKKSSLREQPNSADHSSKSTPPSRTQRKRPEIIHLVRSSCVTRSKARLAECQPESDSDVDAAVDSYECRSAAESAVSIDDLRRLSLPTKAWALHEFPGFVGVCYVCCELHAATSEIRIARTVLFNGGSEGVVHCKVHILGKPVEEADIVSIEQAEDVLRRTASIPICCGAAEVTSVSFGLTRGLLMQSEIYGGTFFSVNCAGKSSKEGQPCLRCKYLRKALETRMCRRRKKIPGQSCTELYSTDYELQIANSRGRH